MQIQKLNFDRAVLGQRALRMLVLFGAFFIVVPFGSIAREVLEHITEAKDLSLQTLPEILSGSWVIALLGALPVGALFSTSAILFCETIVCSIAFILSNVSRLYVIVPSALMFFMPYMTLTSWCTGGEKWRYQAADVINLCGLVVMVIFTRFCYRTRKKVT